MTHRTPRAILDMEGYHYAQLAGRPGDPSYMGVIQGVDQALTDAAGVLAPLADKKGHRRGLYPSLSIGITHGGGSQVRLRPLPIAVSTLTLPHSNRTT